MNKARTQTLAITFAAVLCMGSSAGRALDVSGVWQSSSGTTILIPSIPGAFDLLFKAQNGTLSRASATWQVRGGLKTFSYAYGNSVAVCTPDPRNAFRITVTSPAGATAWTRVSQGHLTPVTGNLKTDSATIAGVWKSSTGSTVVIPASAKHFMVYVKRASGIHGLHPATWKSLRGVKQFTYQSGQFPWTCTVHTQNPNIITVQGSGQSFRWTRSHIMTNTSVAQGGNLQAYRPPVQNHANGYRPPQAQAQQRPAPAATRSTIHNISGVWQSTTGNQIIIPANPAAMDIIFKTTTGQRYLLAGSWVQGQVGRQFFYTLNNKAAVCTLDTQTYKRIFCKVDQTVSTWTRIRTSSSRP